MITHKLKYHVVSLLWEMQRKSKEQNKRNVETGRESICKGKGERGKEGEEEGGNIRRIKMCCKMILISTH